MQFDFAFHVGDLLVILLALLVFVRHGEKSLDWIRTILREYPPHRHVGTKIIYPRGAAPINERN